jgi:PDDEXK-like domain of unknown function (DUF3799)
MIYSELPAAEYHATKAISKSGLDRVNQSPAHFFSWLSEPQKSTPAMELGTATHTAILEPDLFNDTYHVGKIDRRTKEGKAQAEEIEASGKKILSDEDYNRIWAMRNEVFCHPSASELFSCGNAEVSIITEYEGVQAKCRMDFLIDGGLIVDLKTTDSADPQSFAKSCATYRYHVQAAYYMDLYQHVTGEKAQGFYFVSVEKTAPYAVAVYELDAESIGLGRDAYYRNLETYKECLASNQWPAYSTTIESLSLPRWAFQQAA